MQVMQPERTSPMPTEGVAMVVGAGPVGVRVAQEIRRRLPNRPLVVFGAETWQPYNRIRLSSALAGELPWSQLGTDLRLPEDPLTRVHLGCAVTRIDRTARTVTDAQGGVHPYAELILATGSRPHIPDIPGTGRSGVFTFRDMDDAQRLLARRVRSRRTVVLGGGLLGLESARAMARHHTEVWVVEHNDRLMPRQLDAEGSAVLKARVETLGIRICLGDGVMAILGDRQVTGIRLRSGAIIACDTVVVATGIRPNIQLALDAGIAVGRGIKVDDAMRTADPQIYAVGECAEHRGVVYGLVAPGFEQAGVAAHALVGGQSRYPGSVASTRLKVLSTPVFSMGEAGAEQSLDAAREAVYRNETGDYRKLVIRRGRLIGALAVGPWSELASIQEALLRQRRIWPWQRERFRRTGSPWPEQERDHVAQWPATATVCNCMGVTRGTLSNAMQAGCRTAEALSAETGASTVCGSCRPLVQELVGGAPQRQAVPRAGALVTVAALTVALIVLMSAAPVSFPDSAEWSWRWDQLWRDAFYKQVSGFSLLGFMVLLGLLGLRKRVKAVRFGDFAAWRLVHVVLGAAALAVLLLHTGGRLGHGLNAALAITLIGLTVAGGLAGMIIGREHAVAVRSGRRLRRLTTSLHIAALWPLPVLLVFHILKFYWY